MLTFWLVWLVVITLFLVVVESVRYSIVRQMKLDSMSPQSLFGLIKDRKAASAVTEEGNADA